MGTNNDNEVVSRRGFLGNSAGALLTTVAAGEALAQAKKPAAAPAKPAPAKPAAAAPAKPAATEPPPPTVNVAVIGLGPQGRLLLEKLGRLPGANVTAICDTYQAFLNRSKAAAPKAEGIKDYRAVLDRKDVDAVFIATPTHQHKEIVLAAIQAGKNVYLEAPIAHSVEEAKAIALAGKGSKKVFQVGQQNRANPQHHHVHKFISSAVLGNVTRGRGQWHKKDSWYRKAPSNEREQEVNWRLRPDSAAGLIGEVGIHTLDIANWFFKAVPVSAMGFGSLLVHKEDGRKIPDTIECVLEYPGGVRYYYSSTLTNSYDGQYEVFVGTDAAVVLRDERAWLFKEADSPLLGWEVYARKELYGDETGICLVADASKQLAEGKIPGKEKKNPDGKDALYFSCEAFLNSVRDPNKKPDCGALEGYQAAVTAIKANEAVLKGTKIDFQKEWFDLG